MRSSDLEGQIHSLAATIQEQQKQIEQKSSEVNQLTTQYNECNNTRQELQTTLDETRLTLNAVVASKTELESHIIAPQEALGSAQAQVGLRSSPVIVLAVDAFTILQLEDLFVLLGGKPSQFSFGKRDADA